MKLGTVNIAVFLCFICKETISVRVLIVDIPDDVTPVGDNDYFYNDYDQNLPISDVKIPQPKPKQKLHLHKPDNKYYCTRFGSMYGIPPNKHKCVFLRMKRNNGGKLDEIIKKITTTKTKIPILIPNTYDANKFSQDYVDNFWRTGSDVKICTVNDFINNKCKHNSDKNGHRKPTSVQFSEDYVDDYWRTTNEIIDPPPCSISDFINNKCKLNSDDLIKLETSQFSDSKSVKEKGKKPTSATGFSQDYVDDFWRTKSATNMCTISDIINNKCKLNLDDLIRQFSNSKSLKLTGIKPTSAAEFSKDYVDDFWRTKSATNKCTISDIINNKCQINTENLFTFSKYGKGTEKNSKGKRQNKFTHKTETHMPLYAIDYLDFPWPSVEFISIPETNSTGKLFFPKLFETKPKEIGTLRRNNLIQFRPNQFRNKLRSTYSSDTDVSEKSSESEEKVKKEKPKRFQIVKNNKKKTVRKKPKEESNDVDIDSSVDSTKSSDEDAEAIKSSVEKTKPKDVKSDSDVENDLTEQYEVEEEEDSFETGPKKPAERYEYLQGHRIVKLKAIKALRRASRLQTFLPKRYRWKPEDIHHLGYYWFEGPKGAFPSDNM